MSKFQDTLSRIIIKMECDEPLTDQEKEDVVTMCHVVQDILAIKLDDLSKLPWRSAGLDRFYPNRDRHTWRTWTDEEVKYGIPQNAVVGDKDGYFVASVRGIESNYENVEEMERNRDAIVNCINTVHKIHGQLGAVGRIATRVV